MSTEEKKARLSRLLQDFQARHEMTARALARRIKVNPTSMSNYLDGTSYPTPETREKIAKAIGMTSSELESYLNDVPLQPLGTLEETLQDIRAMSDRDFHEVLSVVLERVRDDLRQSPESGRLATEPVSDAETR